VCEGEPWDCAGQIAAAAAVTTKGVLHSRRLTGPEPAMQLVLYRGRPGARGRGVYVSEPAPDGHQAQASLSLPGLPAPAAGPQTLKQGCRSPWSSMSAMSVK